MSSSIHSSLVVVFFIVITVESQSEWNNVTRQSMSLFDISLWPEQDILLVVLLTANCVRNVSKNDWIRSEYPTTQSAACSQVNIVAVANNIEAEVSKLKEVCCWVECIVVTVICGVYHQVVCGTSCIHPYGP